MEELVRSTKKLKKIKTWSLVLSSRSITHTVRHDGKGWTLTVLDTDLENACREIDQYETENTGWPPISIYGVTAPHDLSRQTPTVLLMGVLIILFILSGPWADSSPWFRLGAVDSGQILINGQWWRLATGLTLHADAAHLIGNIFIGGVLIHFLSLTIGTGLCWFLVIASGVIGNLVNIVVHGPGHLSVGFSTSVFGAIGILTGYRCILARGIPFRSIMAPLAAGFALLALLGASGQRTDLGAHLFGILTGIILGTLAALPISREMQQNSSIQTAIFLGTMLFIILCWTTAWG